MLIKRKHSILLVALLFSLVIFAITDLLVGQVELSFSDFWEAIFHFNEQNSSHVIALELRLPRMVMALLAGGALSLAGLLMQTMFQNPLAGPYVLGINSGASLFVAISTMTGITFLTSNAGLIINALLGSLIFGVLILILARFAKTQISLLLAGIMLGSFTSAFIAIIQSLSHSQNLKLFTLWNLGSLQGATLDELGIVSAIVISAVVLSLLLTKNLNILMLGNREAQLLGVKVKRVHYMIIGVTAILAGTITAYCGPIAFVGLAVPNVTRILFKTQNHLILILASFLIGSIFLISTDIIIQLLEKYLLIPVNAITSLVGAPLVVYILFRRVK